ncbi:MAG: hypothetical protein LBB76_04555 [Azoarcus sp.]|nr:hypothetical protein [Azoarcus sp.]
MYRASNLAAALAGGVSSSAITFGHMTGALGSATRSVKNTGKDMVNNTKAAMKVREWYKNRKKGGDVEEA